MSVEELNIAQDIADLTNLEAMATLFEERLGELLTKLQAYNDILANPKKRSNMCVIC